MSIKEQTDIHIHTHMNTFTVQFGIVSTQYQNSSTVYNNNSNKLVSYKYKFYHT